MIPSARRVHFVYNEEMFRACRVGREIVSTFQQHERSALTMKMEKLASRDRFSTSIVSLNRCRLVCNYASDK